MEIKVEGSVTISAPVRTVGDLKELVHYLMMYRVSEEAMVDYGTGNVYILPLGEDFVKTVPIECGDHLSGDAKWDWLIESHQHPELDREERQVCGGCGISSDHDDFGFAATWKWIESKADYDTFCEPCAADRDRDERIREALVNHQPANFEEAREVIETVKDEWRGPGYK